eukprot:9273417-Pyramimonas_sp.AAC.1
MDVRLRGLLAIDGRLLAQVVGQRVAGLMLEPIRVEVVRAGDKLHSHHLPEARVALSHEQTRALP